MKIFPSEANFLLLKTQIPLYRLLLERGILIRNCANYTGSTGLLQNCRKRSSGKCTTD